MSALFLHGALRDEVLLRIVLGPRADAVTMRAATLRDHAVTWAEDHPVPVLSTQPGMDVQGLLLENLDAQQVLRVDFYAGGHGCDQREAGVCCDGASRMAGAYFPQPEQRQAGAPFDLQDWTRRWGAISRAAAIEAMEYFGTCTPGELAARMPMIRGRAASRVAATGVPASVRCDTSAEAVEVLRTQILHVGFYRSEACVLRHPTFEGGMSDALRREVFVATDAALVLPYDPVRDRVLLVEQFRLGPFRRGDPRPWMLEPVAGRVDPGETPEEAAHRECMEEAGVTLTRLERAGNYYCTPGYSTEYFHNFVGIADLPDDLPGYGGLDAEAEDIRLHVLDFDAAMALLDTGEADNGPLILSLLWLARHRDRLRAPA